MENNNTYDMTENDELEAYKKELLDTMLQIGIDPTPYAIAIRITAETLLERERAYRFYKDGIGSRDMWDFNFQSMECLTMLGLTPSAHLEGKN